MHKDVLNAEPETLTEKQSLVEEIKHRAKISIKGKNYPEADTLYSKAIDVLTPSEPKTLSVLYSNRSLCRFSTGKFEEAIDDARSSIDNDGEYVKGYWRLGQALFKAERYGEARRTYEEGIGKLSAGEKDGAWKREVEKCEVKEKEYKELMEGDITKIKVKPTVTSKPSSSKTNQSKSQKKKMEKTVVKDMDTEVEFSQSEVIRGYKIIDGKKTSFFHHEQTEEEKALIGDIAPKRLDSTATSDPASTSSDDLKDVSAWNKAGTWEEKDVSATAKEQLRALLLRAEFRTENAVCTVSSVDKLEGHASVATVRGKRRYIFEFSLTVGWKVVSSSDMEEELGMGKMSFPDIDGTCDGEYEMTDFVVTSCESRDIVDKFVRKTGLKDDVCHKINEWVDTFKAMYSL
jgi:tetratricopeptide (TPR) repeat protein